LPRTRRTRGTFWKDLEKEGFSVAGRSNGREALQQLKGNFFDLVLIDYKMPELDGLQTLREIRKLYPDLPVVMMTAYGTVETAVASIERRSPGLPDQTDRLWTSFS